MALNSLPSTWPRTFSVLGLGATSIFLVFLWTDRSQGTSSFEDLMGILFGIDGQSQTVSLLFFALASYAAGQLALLGGSQTLGLGVSDRLAKIDANVAFHHNSLLAASIKSKTETAELILAAGFLLLNTILWFGLTDLLNGNWRPALYQFPIGVLAAGLMRSFAKDFVSSAQQELEYFEELMKTPQEEPNQ